VLVSLTQASAVVVAQEAPLVIFENWTLNILRQESSDRGHNLSHLSKRLVRASRQPEGAESRAISAPSEASIEATRPISVYGLTPTISALIEVRRKPGSKL
jgi:hypothetical protein